MRQCMELENEQQFLELADTLRYAAACLMLTCVVPHFVNVLKSTRGNGLSGWQARSATRYLPSLLLPPPG
jgi:hypothetical protein